MANKKDETASFVLRFNQKIFHTDAGEPQVQWRGNIRHVQGGDEKRFSEFEDALQFIQHKLTELTIQATEDKSLEERKGILAKSLNIWKQVKEDYSKIVLETIKDPIGSVEQLQEQVQEQVSQMSDRLRPNLDPDSWKPVTRSDLKKTTDSIESLAKAVETLARKVDQMSSEKK
jgi:DNA repair ATPase RecN